MIYTIKTHWIECRDLFCHYGECRGAKQLHSSHSGFKLFEYQEDLQTSKARSKIIEKIRDE